MTYELKYEPLRITVRECECVKYELVFTPILIPADNQLPEATP